MFADASASRDRVIDRGQSVVQHGEASEARQVGEGMREFTYAHREGEIMDVEAVTAAARAADQNWRPYCLACTTMLRMEKRLYGFQCPICRLKVGEDLKKLEEKKR